MTSLYTGQLKRYLGDLPQSPSNGNQPGNHLSYFVGEASFYAVVAAPNHSEDLIDGCVGGEGAVEDVELAFQTLRNIVSSSAWLDHRRQELKDIGRKLIVIFKSLNFQLL